MCLPPLNWLFEDVFSELELICPQKTRQLVRLPSKHYQPRDKTDIQQNITWVSSKGELPLHLPQTLTHTPRKLARYRAQLLEPGPGAGSGGGSGFDVSKSGDARIALVGFPSVGKSTFLSKITKTKSEVAAYSFTTLTAIPGVLEYGGAEIQILDLPGIIEGAAEGKGRGRQVISAAKTSDLILMILDATKKAEQRALLEAELEAVGIRLNREPPFVTPLLFPLPFTLFNHSKPHCSEK